MQEQEYALGEARIPVRRIQQWKGSHTLIGMAQIPQALARLAETNDSQLACWSEGHSGVGHQSIKGNESIHQRQRPLREVG